MLHKSFVNPHPEYLKAAADLRENSGQWDAYESKGNCVMLAGPGSGKTKTLTVKMARLLHEDIRAPQGIACITYSTECARELKSRLERLGIKESRRIFIGTVHGFCLKHVLTPYAQLAGLILPDPLTVADDDTQARLLERVLRRKGVTERTGDVKSRMERYRRTYLDRSSREWRETDQETSEIIEDYEAALRENGYLDFDDLVLLGLRLIKENEWIRKALKAKFPVLVVDEYQDLGAPLHELVLMMCFGSGVRLIAVGDPDQSIYGFTGANPELLRQLAEFPDVEAIRLKLNYRCGKTIVTSSMVALGEDRGYAAANEHEGAVTFWECSNGLAEQTETICQSIIPAALKDQAKRSLGDIGILYINKYDANLITQAVKAHGFKYVGGDKDTRYPNTPLTRWLEDCATWCAGGWNEGAPRLSSLIDFWCHFHAATPGNKRWQELSKTLVSFLWATRNPNLHLKNWLDDFLLVGLQSALESGAMTRPDEKGSFQSLFRSASDPQKLGDQTIGGFGKLRGASDHLNLVTLHSSKGLEFDVVIIMGLEQGRLPSWGSTSVESKREPRRLFYVGLTRARHEVHLVYSGWYANAYGRRFDHGPSEFVVEVQGFVARIDNTAAGTMKW